MSAAVTEVAGVSPNRVRKGVPSGMPKGSPDGSPKRSPAGAPTGLPIDQHRAAALRRLGVLSLLLDSAWRIPGTQRRFGLDAIASVVPVAGSLVGAAVSSYFVLEALRCGAPPRLIVRMLRNVGVDWLLGNVPVLGVVFDLLYKANEANLRLLTAWLRGESRD